MTRLRKGQSLIEILVAFAIVSLVLGAAVVGITVSLRSNLYSRLLRTASAIMQEMMDKARLAAESDWHTIYNPTDKTLPSYVISEGGDLNFINGSEGVLENDVVAGLEGFWKLDEADGTTAYDSSPNNNKGTLTNGPLQAGTANCRVGGCLDFDGVNDYVSFPTITAMSGSLSSLTMSVWLNAAALSGSDAIIMGDGLSAYLLTLHTDGKIWFYTGSGTQNVHAPFTLGQFVHVVAVYDGSAGIRKLYFNGVEAASSTQAGTVPASISGTGGFALGGATSDINGNIDEARVYGRALSVPEIDQLYRSRTYTRYFTAEDVNRTAGGSIITDGMTVGPLDPSTMRINGTVKWDQSQIAATEYVTRSNSRVDAVTDWSDATTYSYQSNLDLTNPGEAKLVGI